MSCFIIVFSSPCKDYKGSDNFSPYLFTKLWKQLLLGLPASYNDEHFNVLPEPLWVSNKHFVQLLLPRMSSTNKEVPDVNRELSENGWFNLDDVFHHDLFLENSIKQLNTVKWDEFDYAEIIAEQLHNIADSKTDKFDFLNTYWLTCGHAHCIESSDNIPLHGALKRLQKWKQASFTFVCSTDNLSERDFTDSWFMIQHRYVVSQDEKMLQDNNVIWQGSLECLQNDESDENWRLSRSMCSVQPSKASLPHSKEDGIPVGKKDHHILADNIKVICELPKDAVPFWKIFPSQFLLYRKSLLKRVFEIKETSSLDFEELSEDKETLVLASIATYDRKHQVQAKTTRDWMDFICSESETSHNEKVKTKCPEIETYHLVLYPVEPGIFIAYFLRPEDSFIDLHSLLAVYQALFPRVVKNTETTTLYEDCQERRWLHLLDAIESSQKSPLKSEFSLAVHLDASEMLKHFTKDGKPMKKELKSLLKQVEEKQKLSPTKQKEMEKRHEMAAGVEYCLDKVSSSTVSSSARLLPKHETLSICNTPKTLAKAKIHDAKAKIHDAKAKIHDAKAKIHDAKRKASKLETLSTDEGGDTEVVCDASTSSSNNIPSEQLKKITRSRPENSMRSSTEQSTRDPPEEEKSKRKRRSFDGNETVSVKPAATNAKEKRSDRHKRRLARVVKRTLIKYGVDPAEGYFTTCSERLYYLCKSFLKDLKTSEGLNDEMKRLAESNVATVVEFEKRQHASKTGEKPLSTTTNC